MKITAEVAQKYPSLEELVRLYSSRQGKSVFWEDKVHGELEIVDASPNKLIWDFQVKEKHCNQ